jgi:hypothetical protein
MQHPCEQGATRNHAAALIRQQRTDDVEQASGMDEKKFHQLSVHHVTAYKDTASIRLTVKSSR